MNAEAADNITIDVVLHDGAGDPVEEAVTVHVESFDANMDPVVDADVLRLSETGAGAAVSAADKPRFLFTTGAAGAAQITAHDQAGASGLAFRLKFTILPAVGVVGQSVIQLIQFD